MCSESRRLLVLLEHERTEWARRLRALGERRTVRESLREALRRHPLLLNELPVTGHTVASIVEYLVEHPYSPGLRFIFVSAAPERLVERDNAKATVTILATS